MLKATLVSVDLMNNLDLQEIPLQEITAELNNGVTATDEDKLTEFKVEQKIYGLEANSEFKFGSFVNSNSRVKFLQTSYRAALMSNRYKVLTDANGDIVVLRRLGIGFELMLEVKDIKTKINANYGVIAASGALNLASANYKITVYGVISAELAQYLPAQEGRFTEDIFQKIQGFFDKAKELLGTMNKSKLYPIEIISNTQIVPDKNNAKSIYYGAWAVASGKKLFDVLQGNNNKYDENVIRFMYSYFEIDNGYIAPTTQRDNAAKWISGTFNTLGI